MKLAWKEIRHSKTKYLLIEGILVLMIFMVVFLSGLANGLGDAISASGLSTFFKTLFCRTLIFYTLLG